MDWDGLKRVLFAEHSGDPRTLAYMEEAIRQGRESLRLFAQHGHQYHLAPGPGAPQGAWPRMMFHVNSAPNGRMVQNEYELYDLGEGWEDSLEAAQVKDGIMAQFSGRGGVSRRSLPVLTKVDQEHNAEWDAFNSENKRAAIAAFKAAAQQEE